jgi:acyl carrier protein
VDPVVTDRNELAERIKWVFIESVSPGLSAEVLRFTERLDEVAGLDSIALLEFVVALEKEFSFKFAPEQLRLELLRDLAGLTTYIAGRVSGDRR